MKFTISRTSGQPPFEGIPPVEKGGIFYNEIESDDMKALFGMLFGMAAQQGPVIMTPPKEWPTISPHFRIDDN